MKEWRNVDEGTPRHDRLKELHGLVVRQGPGDFLKWRSYLGSCRLCQSLTDGAGRLLPPPKKIEKVEEAPVEKYEPRKEMYSIDDVEAVVQKNWSVKKEKAQREKENAKVKEFEAERSELLADRSATRKSEGRVALAANKDAVFKRRWDDDDSLFVERNSNHGDDDGRPANLEGYSYSDDADQLILFLELSRPVKAQDLDVRLLRKTIRVVHRNKVLLNRKWQKSILANADETTWYLEDGGSTMRLEVVKEKETTHFEAPPRQPNYFDDDEEEEEEAQIPRERDFWPCVFEGDAYRSNRTTKTDENFGWSQTPTQVTVVCDVPLRTKANDVTITMRRDFLRVYVRKAGLLIDGTLNRSIKVSDSTWYLEADNKGKLNIVLTKVEIDRAWQRLISGQGDDHNLHDAYDDVAQAAPADLDLPKFDDMTISDKYMMLRARQYHQAKAQKNEALAEELLAEIDDMQPKTVTADLDRSVRDHYEKRIRDHDAEAMRLSAVH